MTPNPEGQNLTGMNTNLVSRVIDGDTVELGNSERVRLLGIDTPERGQFLFKESTEWLKDKIEGKRVRLESDIEDKDKYDRLLRHIFLGNEHINLKLVELGYANTLFYGNEKYREELLAAEAEARDKGTGIWHFNRNLFCIGIFQLHYNAKGDDNENLNDEYVILRNKCENPVSMDKWLLKDESGIMYEFKNLLVKAKAKFTLHTGQGNDNETDIYWNRARAVWNNNGDILKVWNANREPVLEYQYP
ncbi:MAG: thermonuclease family protein [Candidatus Aenigmarchaeota archaeon]|nr:thermonuclease family protein [Candidatus Aenigmarchaeota archaeon]